MDWSMLGNPVLLSVVMLLALSALRLNVVFSLILASVFGGVIAGSAGYNYEDYRMFFPIYIPDS